MKNYFTGFTDNDGNDIAESESEDVEFDEEGIIRYYFHKGFEYKEILLFLGTYHDYHISYSTLLRRLKQYGIGRREQQIDYATVRRRISEINREAGSLSGYRSVWHTLEMEGLRVPRIVVEEMLREIDPQGTAARKAHRLKRRVYSNPGPNYSWHIDGYDKLKHWGFPIHGGIDGFSRKILWLNVTRSNNSPDNIASFYLNIVRELGGCPVELVSDLGTENGLAAAIQSFFRDNPDAHRYVSSPRNQRIEGWWSFYSRNRSHWWKNFFADLESQGILDTSSEVRMECLWYCFSPLIQEDLNFVMNQWNTHRIRKSRHDTVSGRPDALFFLPQHYGGVDGLKLQVPQAEIDHVAEHIVVADSGNDYQEYFEYVKVSLGIENPTNCQEALDLYHSLILTAGDT